MTRRTTALIIGVLMLVGQLIVFRDYISPVQWGQIKVSGLACTCPDEFVVNGQWYLKALTPDSLVTYDLDYSEIYVTERPSTELDPMGADCYIITGQVIGKERIDQSSSWNPVVKVNSWREVNLLKDWTTKIFFSGQIVALILIWSRRK